MEKDKEMKNRDNDLTVKIKELSTWNEELWKITKSCVDLEEHVEEIINEDKSFTVRFVL